MAGDLNFPLAGDHNFRLAGDLSDLIWVSSQAQPHSYPPGPEPWLSSDESSSYKMVKFHNMVKLKSMNILELGSSVPHSYIPYLERFLLTLLLHVEVCKFVYKIIHMERL